MWLNWHTYLCRILAAPKSRRRINSPLKHVFSKLLIVAKIWDPISWWELSRGEGRRPFRFCTDGFIGEKVTEFAEHPHQWPHSYHITHWSHTIWEISIRTSQNMPSFVNFSFGFHNQNEEDFCAHSTDSPFPLWFHIQCMNSLFFFFFEQSAPVFALKVYSSAPKISVDGVNSDY